MKFDNSSCEIELPVPAVGFVLTQYHPESASPLYVGQTLGPQAKFISDIGEAHVFATQMLAIRAACNILELHNRVCAPVEVHGREPTIQPRKGRRCRSCQVSDMHPPLLLGIHGWAETDLCGECKNPLLLDTWMLFAPVPDRPTFVARRFVNGIPTLDQIEAKDIDSLNQCRDGRLCIGRQPSDPPGVVGMWL